MLAGRQIIQDFTMSSNKCNNCGKAAPANSSLTKMENCVHVLCSSCLEISKKRKAKQKVGTDCVVCAKTNGDETLFRPSTGPNRPVTAQSECPICTDHYSSPRSLPCGHKFCTECFDKWEERSSTCPLCRVIVDEEKERELQQARETRRQIRRSRSLRGVNSPFLDPLFKTSMPSAIVGALLLVTGQGLFTAGIFGVADCHSMMFTGFPFWTGLHMVVVAIMALITACRSTSTVLVGQIVLAGFGVLFGTMSLCLAILQIYATINDQSGVDCNEKPWIGVDIFLLIGVVLCILLSTALIIISMVGLGANPAICCLKRFLIPNADISDNALMHFNPGRFFPQEIVVTTISVYEKVLNVSIIVINMIALSAAVAAFVFCHAFRATGMFLWGPLFQISFSAFHCYTHSNATWCKLTTSMIFSSFSTLLAFIMTCFGTG